MLRSSIYEKAFKGYSGSDSKYLLDYTVPFMRLNLNHKLKHIQIGVLKTTNSQFLQGPFDFCFGLEENHIYPCHAGCIINLMEKREDDETGSINLTDIVPIWKKANKYGLQNKVINFE